MPRALSYGKGREPRKKFENSCRWDGKKMGKNSPDFLCVRAGARTKPTTTPHSPPCRSEQQGIDMK